MNFFFLIESFHFTVDGSDAAFPRALMKFMESGMGGCGGIGRKPNAWRCDGIPGGRVAIE
jgi:hypothetical protein